MPVYVTDGKYVYYENGVFLGEIVIDVSGEPLFFEDDDKGTRGGWPAHLLRAIADELDMRNVWIQDPTMGKDL